MSTRTSLPDRYEPIGLVARGGMASVWRARDRKLDREVAVKLLAERYANDETAVRRFKREARAAARLSGHPNVVTIYDVGQRPPSEEAPFGHPYIVMEFLAGATAAEALRRGEVTPAEAVVWLYGAAAALDYAHGRGVIHRDVKLSNFLLDDRRVLHVADFGIASLGTDDTLTASGQLLGTAGYLAPERALGQPATPASDRYSLAVATFELLAGERPFRGEEIAVLARQHIEARPPLASVVNPALPKAVDAPLQRGMAKEPERRWPTATSFAEAIEHAASARRRSPLAARTPVAAARSPLAAPRPLAAAAGHRRAVALAGLAGCALLAGIAVATGGTARHAGDRALAAHRAIAHPPPPLSRPPARRSAPPAHPATTSSSAPATTSSPAGGADALESRGHSLMEAGDYAAAIPVLRQAIAAAPPGSLTYAYALYDLGRSLRLAGDPQAAIPILFKRLSIPNQTDVVRTELQLAMQAAGRGGAAGSTRPAGQAQSSGGGAPAPAGPHPKHRDRHPNSGGAAFGQGQGD